MSGVSRAFAPKAVEPEIAESARAPEAAGPAAGSNAVHDVGNRAGNQAAQYTLHAAAPAQGEPLDSQQPSLADALMGAAGWATESEAAQRAPVEPAGLEAGTVQDPKQAGPGTEAQRSLERLDNRKRRGARPQVPWSRQTGNACGTTSLSAILRYWGDRDDVTAKTPGEVDAGIRDADIFTSATAMQRYAQSQGLSSAGINNGTIEQLREVTQKGLVAQCFVDSGAPHWVVVSAVYEDSTGKTMLRIVDSGSPNSSYTESARDFLKYGWQDPLPVDVGYHCFYIVYAPKSQEEDLPESDMSGVLSVDHVVQQLAHILNGAVKLGDGELTQKIRGLLEVFTGAASGVISLPAAVVEVLAKYVDIPVVKQLLGGASKLITVPLRVLDDLLTGIWDALFGDGDSERHTVYKEIMTRGSADLDAELVDVGEAVRWVRVMCEGPTTDRFEWAILKVLNSARRNGFVNDVIRRVGWRTLYTNMHGAEFEKFYTGFAGPYWKSASLDEKKTAVIKHAGRQARCGFLPAKTILEILQSCTPADIAEIDRAVRQSSRVPLSSRFNRSQLQQYRTLRGGTQ